VGFIEHSSFFEQFSHEIVAHGEAFANLLRGSHQQIHRERRAEFEADLDGFLYGFAFEWEHDEQVDVGIGRSRSARVGAEQQHTLRPELAAYIAPQLLYLCHRHHGLHPEQSPNPC
jgi:hypothetical protein